MVGRQLSKMSHWTWAVASARGTSHQKSKTRCQDAQLCRAIGTKVPAFASVIADGAGSSRLGGEGASLVCRQMMSLVLDHFKVGENQPSDDALSSWLEITRATIRSVAAARSAEPRDFASTLVLAIATPTELAIAHVGDGGVVFRGDRQDEWKIGSWPAHGEYINTTAFVTDAKLSLRITRHKVDCSGVVLFTDGLERLLLDFGKQEPHQPFFAEIIRSLDVLKHQGRNQHLCRSLGEYLDSEAINSRTDDDKTLVLAACR